MKRVLYSKGHLLLTGIFCFFLFFSTCEKDIDLTLPNQKELVVLSNFSPDSLFRLYLSTTVPFTGPGNSVPEYPEDAEIQLFEDGGSVQSFIFHKDNFGGIPYYYINKPPRANVEYSISVAVDGYPNAKSNNVIPKKIPIDNFELLSVTSEEYPNFPWLFAYRFKTRLKASVSNEQAEYFHLRAWRNIISFYIENADTIKMNYWERLPIGVINNGQQLEILHEPGVLIDGETFFGNQAGLEIEIALDHFPERELKTPLYIELRHVSEDYYLFHKSIGEQEFSSFGESILSTESVSIHNNIEGGVGNFGGYNAAVDSIFW